MFLNPSKRCSANLGLERRSTVTRVPVHCSGPMLRAYQRPDSPGTRCAGARRGHRFPGRDPAIPAWRGRVIRNPGKHSTDPLSRHAERSATESRYLSPPRRVGRPVICRIPYQTMPFSPATTCIGEGEAVSSFRLIPRRLMRYVYLERTLPHVPRPGCASARRSRSHVGAGRGVHETPCQRETFQHTRTYPTDQVHPVGNMIRNRRQARCLVDGRRKPR